MELNTPTIHSNCRLHNLLEAEAAEEAEAAAEAEAEAVEEAGAGLMGRFPGFQPPPGRVPELVRGTRSRNQGTSRLKNTHPKQFLKQPNSSIQLSSR